MHELKKILSQKVNEKGDRSYTTTGNKMLDVLFMTQYFRHHLSEVPHLGTSGKAKIFARFIRDPRHGLGERDLGRVLMENAKVAPLDIYKSGRADDLLFIGTADCVQAFIFKLEQGDINAKKWAPRIGGKHSAKTRAMGEILVKLMHISYRQYRQLIKLDSTERKLSEHRVKEIDYAKVPSKAMMKYFHAFKRLDEKRFEQYLESVEKGKAKMNVGTTNVYDIYKTFVILENGWMNNKIIIKDGADVVFNQIKKTPLGSILCILDNSGSMYDGNDSAGKSKAVAHYVAKNTTYMPNHIMKFSHRPALIELGENYADDMKRMHSFNDVGTTNFSAVMNVLEKLEHEFPEWILVLSDMEFDEGSSTRKETAMKNIQAKSPHTKIIWWTFNTRNKTVPEIDEYGNIFISGYSPQMLQYLECGFDAEKFLNKLLKEYTKKVS